MATDRDHRTVRITDDTIGVDIMATELSTTDTLGEISYENDALEIDDPQALYNKVSSTNGEIVIVSAFGCSLVVIYSFTAQGLNIQLVLKTPVGSVVLANVTLNPAHPSITSDLQTAI
ncbi:MAG: hypothetical protein EOP66_18145 [Sphingomonas sp.]|nr:MAG: hypothetical protein EOP66_18145 [Sphingomonas sp.]